MNVVLSVEVVVDLPAKANQMHCGEAGGGVEGRKAGISTLWKQGPEH